MSRKPTKIVTKWDLTHIYKSPKDSKIEKDLQAFEKACLAFEKKYRGKESYLKSDQALLNALQEYEKLDELAEGNPYIYFYLRKDLDSSDAHAQSMLNKLQNRITEASNRIQFFELSLGKIPTTQQKCFLGSKKLEQFKYYLERIFIGAKYNLSEPEEKLLNLMSQPSYSMWVDGVEKVLTQKTVQHGKKELSIDEALSLSKFHKSRSVRRKLRERALEQMYDVSHFAEAELNAVVTRKKITDKLRGYSKPYESTVLGYENDIETVEQLVKTVTAHNGVARRFFDLKRDILGYDALNTSDIYIPTGKVKHTFSFKDSVALYREILYGVHERYGKIFDDFLAKGKIDVFPKKGKSSGAYHMPGTKHSRPGYVLLNHTGEINSFSTLAHEMGHAIHSERSNTSQPPLYRGYTTSVAETASTFFENIALNHVLNLLPDNEKAVLLEQRIGNAMATVFRQIGFFNFEKELHEKVREDGYVQKEEIASLLLKQQKAINGKAVKPAELDGYFFVYVSHFRRFFYVYSYAFGDLISRALYEKYREDPSFIEVADRFMTAGNSAQPEDIFKSIGFDIRDSSFWELGIKNIEKDIKELKRLTSSKKK